MPALERLLKPCGEAQLVAALLILQGRLGTPSERSNDLERARIIAHQLNNLRTAQVLIDEIEQSR